MSSSEKLGQYSIDCQHCLFWDQVSIGRGDGYCRRFPPANDTPRVPGTCYCGEGLWVIQGQVMSIAEAVTVSLTEDKL